MPLSFPSNPSVGQQSTQNGRTYQWSGYAWEIVASGVSLDASQITSGTIAPARLASGTADATTFLRGDNVWSGLSAIYNFTRSAAPSGATGAAPGPYTWTVPSGARAIRIISVSGGGGGGSGRRGDSSTLCGGGGGGGSGDVRVVDLLASDLSSQTLWISVGAGGAGAASITTDNTNGVQGGIANVTVVRITNSSGADVSAHDSYGWRGTGGSSTAGGTGGAGAWAHFTPGMHSTGGAGGNGTTAAGNSTSNPFSAMASPSGGGGGGGLSTAGATQSGGFANCPYRADGLGPIASGGTAGNGGANGGVMFGQLMPMGVGGGGGGSSTTAAGGNGGNGAFPGGGGGGGGASRNGFASGAGGNGAPGMVRIIVYW